jgi:S-DNA-T family DNA segregation ATPase FtsK/SpoIIIE
MKNTYKSKAAKKEKPKISFDFLSDRKFHLFIGFTLLLTSVFLLVSFFSYLNHGPADQSVVEAYTDTNIKESGLEVRNIFGVVGAICAHYFIFLWFGIASFLIPPLLLLTAIKIIWHRELLPLFKSFNFTVFYLIWISMVMGYFLLDKEEVTTLSFLTGGIGYELAIISTSLLGWGALLFFVFLLVVFNMFFFNITKVPAINSIAGVFTALIEGIREQLPKKRERKQEDISTVLEKVKKEVEREDEDSEEDETATWVIKKIPAERKTQKPKQEKNDASFTIDLPEVRNEPRGLPKEVEDKVFAPKESARPDYTENESERETDFDKKDELEDLSFEVEQKDFAEEVAEEIVNYDPTLDLPNYRFPNPDLLIDYPQRDVQVSKQELEQNKDRILETLVNFKIGISSIKATIGPTVTLYEIVPEAGVKISKIKNLEDDIALSLAALGIRIIAPIPGKGTIGIEVPNKNREMVDIKSVITTSKFMESKMELPIVFGKTISNEVYVTDLSKMPHLLMAGATGQGKSVGLNVMLASLLYKKHPSQLKLVLVDPKKVELTLYNKIERHFLAKLPDSEDAIITDTKKVVNTLNSLCI